MKYSTFKSSNIKKHKTCKYAIIKIHKGLGKIKDFTQKHASQLSNLTTAKKLVLTSNAMIISELVPTI